MGLEWLKPNVILGTILYAVIGVVVLWLSFVVIDKINLGAGRQPRAGMIDYPMAAGGKTLVAPILHLRAIGLPGIERRNDPFADQRLSMNVVIEDRLGNVIFPEKRRPEEEGAARGSRRRSARVRLAQLAHTP